MLLLLQLVLLLLLLLPLLLLLLLLLRQLLLLLLVSTDYHYLPYLLPAILSTTNPNSAPVQGLARKFRISSA